MENRLQKVLARAGVASRRGAERLIRAGRVKVNGEVVGLGTKVDDRDDIIEVDGQVLGGPEAPAYYILYKPVGFITSMKDPAQRPSVKEFMTGLEAMVFPVGRLDMDAEGLILLTNDGPLAARLMHPRFHVTKTYRVKVKGLPTAAALKKLAEGQILLGDRRVKPARVEVIKTGPDRAWIHLTLTEGRRHQVKRMCARIGHPVLKLKRVGYGPLALGHLKPGETRPLKTSEIQLLKAAAEGVPLGEDEKGKPA